MELVEGGKNQTVNSNSSELNIMNPQLYNQIKAMDRLTLSSYLLSIFEKGYMTGREDVLKAAEAPKCPATVLSHCRDK